MLKSQYYLITNLLMRCIPVMDIQIHSGKEMLSCSGITERAQRRLRSSRNDWLIEIKNSHDQYSQRRPQIQRVPRRLREVKAYEKCFDPVVASIGPYHHGRPEFESMESLKAASAHQFISGSGREIDFFYQKIFDVVPEVRKWYADGSTEEFDEEALARIIFIDGCFVLHFIDCFVNDKLGSELKTNSYNVAFLLRDMFLLENQLPYSVLQVLIKLRFPSDHEGKKAMINNFIDYQISPLGLLKLSSTAVGDQQQPLHLLHLLRIKMLGDLNIYSSSKSSSLTTILHSFCTKMPCLHRYSTTSSSSKSSSTPNWHSFRSVKELLSVGINFKKSSTCCLKDIHFKACNIYGELSLPPIVIDYSAKPKFLNLMVHELFLDAFPDYSFTSYICFLDSLIYSADDVKELRSKGILLNALGSDDQVADLFNKLADEMVPDPHAYQDVKGAIEKHYQSKTKVSLVEFLTTRFRSPWTAFGFLAATLVIILTCIQTVFTIYPR